MICLICELSFNDCRCDEPLELEITETGKLTAAVAAAYDQFHTLANSCTYSASKSLQSLLRRALGLPGFCPECGDDLGNPEPNAFSECLTCEAYHRANAVPMNEAETLDFFARCSSTY